MPMFGDVQISDDAAAALAGTPAAAARPTLGSIFSGAAQQAYGQVRYGIPLAVEKLGGNLTQADSDFYTKGLADSSAAATAAAPASFGDVTSGKVGFARFLGENAASMVPGLVAPIAGGAIAGLAAPEVAAAGLVGSIAAGIPQFAGSGVAHAVETNGGLSSEAAARALALSPVESAINIAGERFLPGAGHFLGDAAATQTGSFLARVAKGAIEGAGVQAFAAATTAAGDRYVAGQDTASPDAIGSYVNTAATAFAIGGVLGGIGGVVNRGPALNKPASDVTVPDTDAHTDGVLNGQQALPAPAPQLALPAPDPNAPTVAQRADLVSDPRGNTAPNTPSGLAGLAATPIADVAVDSGGNAIVSPTAADLATQANPAIPGAPTVVPSGLDLARASFDNADRTRQIGDTVRDILSGRSGNAVPDALAAQPRGAFDPAAALEQVARDRSSTSPRALEAGDFNGLANTVETGVRAFKDEPIEDLHAAVTAKGSSVEVKAEAAREIAARTLEATGNAPLTADAFQTRVDDMKQGLRGSFVAKLEATSPTDLLNKVYDQVLVNQDTGSSVTKLAQRVGLLDEKLDPTPLANRIEATRLAKDQADAAPPEGTPVTTDPTNADPAAADPSAPVDAPGVSPLTPPDAVAAGAEAPADAATPDAPAPVAIAATAPDPDYAAKFDQLKKDAGIDPRRNQAGLKAAGLDVAPANEADARAKVFAALATDSTESNVSQVEKLAKGMGLIDANREVTPLGQRTHLLTPDGDRQISAAAREQGLEGTDNAAFKEGARAVATGTESAGHTTFEDMAGYQAGKVWAEDQVRNAATKETPQSEAIRSRKGEGESDGAKLSSEEITDRQLEPGEVRHKALNQLIDSANLRDIPDREVAGLRKMVTEGATPLEIGKRLQDLQGGVVKFDPPPRPEGPLRGVARFQELNPARTAAQARAAARTEAATGQRVYDQRNAIRQAVTDGDITAARGYGLNRMLDAGNVDQVENLTKDFGSISRDARNLASGGSLGDVDHALEQAVAGKSFAEVAQHLVDTAPTEGQAEIMRRVQALAAQVEKAGGHSFDFQVVKPGDEVPLSLKDADVRGQTVVSQNPARATVYVKSAEMGPEHGVNFQIMSHEMIHAVTLQALDFARRTDPEGKTALGKAALDLRTLANDVRRHLYDKLDNGDRLEHTNFELSAALGEHNAFQDEHELLAWGLTNPDMQRYLQSIAYTPKVSVFSKFVGLVRDMLGLKNGNADTALTELLRVSEQVLGTDARELAPAFERGTDNAGDTATLRASIRAGGESAANRTVDSSNDVTQRVVKTVGDVIDRLPVQDLKGKIRRLTFGLLSQNQLDRVYGHALPEMLQRTLASRMHDAVRGNFSLIGEARIQRYNAFEAKNPEMAKTLQRFMSDVTENQINPDKTFAEHTHLTGDADPLETARVKSVYDRIQKVKNDLRRGDGEGWATYEELKSHNDMLNYSQLAVDLHRLVTSDPEFSQGVAGSEVNPMETFLTTKGLTTADQIRDHWDQALKDQVSAVNAFVQRKMGEVAAGTASAKDIEEGHLQFLEDKLRGIREARAGMDRSPYFHLGRYGDHYASATIAKLENGRVNPKSQEAVTKALQEANFFGVRISTDNTNPKFSTKLPTVDAANRMRAVLEQLHADGHLDGEIGDIQAGPSNVAANIGVLRESPQAIRKAIQSVADSPIYKAADGATASERVQLEARKQEAIGSLRDAYLEQQADSSISKVLTKRNNVSGYDPDAIRNFAFRSKVAAGNLANVSTASRMAAAMDGMRARLSDARHSGSGQDVNLVSDLLREQELRNARTPVAPTISSFAGLRSIGHAYYLGMNPAYAAMQIMQIGTNGIPELAKKYGYNRSFHAVRLAGADAFAVMRAASAEAAKGGLAHAADVKLTENALQNSGLSQSKQEFLRRIIAEGSISIGQSAHALEQAARSGGATKDTILNYASAMGVHAETFSRLIVALAAHDLHGGDDIGAKTKYASNVISNSMYDFQSSNTARLLGKQGFAGPITPLLTQFMSYTTQMTEKLYSEGMNVLGRPRAGESVEATAQRAKEARTYLLGHLTAVTALAGTLGLPFAGAFAGALEKAVNTLGPSDKPFDVTASWRNFLAQVLGKSVGEVVARGLPRALGVDLSTRMGEQDLLPFTELLGDRRDFKEGFAASYGKATGASADMLLNVVGAGHQFSQGDVIGGMKSILPVAAKNPLEAYRMASQGYVDAQGRKLPMTPGAGAILYQLLGFTPEAKGEYAEARDDQNANRVGLTTESKNLRTAIVRAMATGNHDRATELVQKAQAFDAANHAYAVLPTVANALAGRQTSIANARALGTPLGVNPTDINARSLTAYANFQQRAN